ncbi:MAG: glycogen/starch/alpha-glucan phosphorylase, partial [Oscillospiraceae bacterium]|nr:glycogen/starch/alpha-glucan phosphorylase [Oscillospiraceae bacterium]
QEPDAGLGNGGLGRLAACFMDAAVTTGVPLTGYGLRYKFGLFKQSWDQYGDQKQSADDWSKYGDPWSYRRYKHTVKIDFPDHSILAVPYDVPVIGFKNNNIGTLRLWQCEAEEELDFDAFNAQEYERALAAKNKAEDITRVLYPNDSNREGKRLRIKQQYVLSSASVQDILRAFREYHGTDYNQLPEFVSIQLNDTHPAMSAAELVRLLMKEGYSFDTAFDISRRVFSYTNHTVMSEALEKWPLDLLASVVPEIVDIIWAIHHKLQSEHPQLYIIKDNTAHMANLSIYMGTSVNGVAQIHSELIKTDIFADWYAVYPERFKNVTNGITPRRWLGLCNSELTSMLEDYCGEGFLTNLDQLETLKTKIDKEMIDRFNGIKYEKKKQLCALIKEREGVELNPDFVFDIQVKRLHEYKRQLLNAFSVMDIYFDLKEGKLPNFNPTAFIFGAKAAPGYHRAKSIIRYINRIANLVNNDPEVNDKIKVVFVQNYNCSYAEYLIPAADISEQISPAGTEASGTGNMKFMLNGAVTLGTLDGANVEIVEKAGSENNYIFGATIEDIERIKNSYRSRDIYDNDYRIRRVVDTLVDGTVPTDEGMRELHTALIDGASYHKPDHYYLLLDYVSYLVTKKRAISDWSNRDDFARKCLMNIGSAGKFSSDRSITDYANTIWYV